MDFLEYLFSEYIYLFSTYRTRSTVSFYLQCINVLQNIEKSFIVIKEWPTILNSKKDRLSHSVIMRHSTCNSYLRTCNTNQPSGHEFATCFTHEVYTIFYVRVLW